jgi:glycosyltransferase involved in cell wall biosynthesis
MFAPKPPRRRTYLWQRPDWPQWRFDAAALAVPLAQVHRAQGHLAGRMGELGLVQRDQATLQALAQMARSPQYQDLLTSVALIIAGDGSMRDEIAQGLSALPCPVHFLGRVDPTAVPALLINSDIHITASEKETKGLTLLEAFAAGIPVLAPRAGGIVDSLESGQTGLLFRPQDSTDFVAKLQQLVTDPDLRQQMGANAKSTVADADWDAAVGRLLEIWQQQLERAQVKRARA